LIVAAGEDELDAYEQKSAVIFQRQRQRGLPSADDLHEVSPAEAQAMFPALGTVLRALYFRGGTRVDGRLLAAALLRGAKRYNLRLELATAEKLIVQNGRVTGALIGSEVYSAPRVIIAGGAWSSDFGAQLGVHIPVEPQRGQIIHLRLPTTNTSTWPIIGAFHGHYIVAWPDGRVVAGATRETDSGYAPRTTVAGVYEVLGEALRVAPGLRDAQIDDIRVGLRPRTVDNLPVLGAVPGIEGVYLATGHGANGLQLGPYSGKLAADWALGLPTEFDISAYSIERFHA
jgi:D-amino-acid dehydrogenase